MFYHFSTVCDSFLQEREREREEEEVPREEEEAVNSAVARVLESCPT